MIREFLYKYYIDPIMYGQPYTIVDTLTYALILILSVYLVYRGLRRFGIEIDRDFVLATIPFVILGGLLRVVEDTGMIASDLRILLITPIIFFVVFFITVGALFLSRLLEVKGVVREYSRTYGLIGVALSAAFFVLLILWGAANTRVDLVVLLAIPAMAAVSSAAVFAFLRYVLGWEYVSDPLYLLLIVGHLFDASATSFGIDLHSLHYVEQHVVGSALIEWSGTAFSMFPLKLAVIVPAIYVLELYRKEGNVAFWHLVLLAMIVVGMAPGVRDMMRMVIYV
ncbi:protein of unknown function DUF63 [Methanofollis liminatans DSM 4140]|jgi:uncharacterized membrane protein|uniref:DUF63 family protein n=1 Tax=Methanofollis liminatans DSM 4140 TaxID=28892 RepID=J0SB09_9EURY|nr:DUF63 family protein [Methanofollis liminatans]EJG07879.1 protein of unknown function DUF63 [Methanofollis liminatans DSM 4140]